MATLLKSASEIIVSLSILGGGILWSWNYVGKPWAQELIVETVNERLSTVERTQRQIVRDLGTLVQAQEAEAEQSEGEAAVNEQILCLLRAQVEGFDVGDC